MIGSASAMTSGTPGFTASGPFPFMPPTSFNGKREDFEEFAFKMKAYLQLMDTQYANIFSDIEENLNTEITEERLTDVEG